MAPERDDPKTTSTCSVARRAGAQVPETAPPPSAPKPRPRARMAERDEAAARDEFAMRSTKACWIPTMPWPTAAMRSHRASTSGSSVARSRPRTNWICTAPTRAGRGSTARVPQRRTPARRRLRPPHSRQGVARPVIAERCAVRWQWPAVLKPGGPDAAARADILAFHSTPPAQGSPGAVLVLLAPPKRR